MCLVEHRLIHTPTMTQRVAALVPSPLGHFMPPPVWSDSKGLKTLQYRKITMGEIPPNDKARPRLHPPAMTGRGTMLRSAAGNWLAPPIL